MIKFCQHPSEAPFAQNSTSCKWLTPMFVFNFFAGGLTASARSYMLIVCVCVCVRERERERERLGSSTITVSVVSVYHNFLFPLLKKRAKYCILLPLLHLLCSQSVLCRSEKNQQ